MSDPTPTDDLLEDLAMTFRELGEMHLRRADDLPWWHWNLATRWRNRADGLGQAEAVCWVAIGKPLKREATDD